MPFAFVKIHNSKMYKNSQMSRLLEHKYMQHIFICLQQRNINVLQTSVINFLSEMSVDMNNCSANGRRCIALNFGIYKQNIMNNEMSSA